MQVQMANQRYPKELLFSEGESKHAIRASEIRAINNPFVPSLIHFFIRMILHYSNYIFYIFAFFAFLRYRILASDR